MLTIIPTLEHIPPTGLCSSRYCVVTVTLATPLLSTFGACGEGFVRLWVLFAFFAIAQAPMA